MSAGKTFHFSVLCTNKNHTWRWKNNYGEAEWQMKVGQKISAMYIVSCLNAPPLTTPTLGHRSRGGGILSLRLQLHTAFWQHARGSLYISIQSNSTRLKFFSSLWCFDISEYYNFFSIFNFEASFYKFGMIKDSIIVCVLDCGTVLWNIVRLR